MKCKICSHSSHHIFNAAILNKYNAGYYKCGSCGFIQTEEPFWLTEAYTSAITTLDIGLLYRNLLLLPITSAIINKNFNPSANFIDYGGGYGVFTRLMRDSGFNYFRQDVFCDNLFAKNFDVADVNKDVGYEMLTAFEVFEHLVDPMAELNKILKYSDNIFFSTELVPPDATKSNWWYFMPETGQHISFYTEQSLRHMANVNKLNFYTNRSNLHLFTRHKINPFIFKLLTRYKVAKIFNFLTGKRPSLLQRDYNYILNKIQGK